MSRRRSLDAVRPTDPVWRDASRAWEIAMTAPQVIAMRCLQMAAAGPRPTRRDRAEFARMGSEKLNAFNAAWLAMSVECWRYWTSVGVSMASGGAAGTRAVSLPNLVGNALAPVHRAVRANGKRLTRARRVPA